MSEYFAALGRKDAIARAKRLTPEQRREIAKKAGKASGKARRAMAKKTRKKG